MNRALFPGHFQRAHCPNAVIAAVLIGLALLCGSVSSAGAHAELARSNPPADGLSVTSPDVLTLTFTEDVELESPAPRIDLLDDSGEAVGASPLPIGRSNDPRTLVVDVPDLDRGTYTVSWTVTSATDGHTLTGAYAFRVGGGLPPGLASTPEATPAVWAVATRWLTFLGVAAAAGMLLSTHLWTAGASEPARWNRWRSRIVLGGTLLALAATLAEPTIQWLTADQLSLRNALESLPDGWWWRPAMLVPLAGIAIAMLAWRRLATAMMTVWVGASLALGALLGLSLTSHAAGRENYRTLAVATDILHQWSVALWTGGLVALAAWALTRPQPAIRFGRFSAIALGLVAVALVTGVVNTGFAYPVIDQIREDGWSASLFEPLWTSNYGIILSVKLLVLIAPLALAAYHRRLITRIGRAAANAVTSAPGRFRKTVGVEVALVAVVVLGGSAMALSAPPTLVEPVLDEVTLVASTSAEPAPDTMLAHLTIDPAEVGDNAFFLRLTDWDGVPLPADPPPSVSLGFTSLDQGGVTSTVQMQHESGGYRTEGLNLSLDGWWRIGARVNLPGRPAQEAAFLALLPDPNTQGSDAAPNPPTNPDAEALFDVAYDQMLAWKRVRWTESLGSGSDVLVRGDFMVIDGAEEADAYSLDVRYSAGFAPNSLGEAPEPPTYESRHSITIGDQAWLQVAGGAWLDQPPIRFATPAEWNETYAGATGFRLGINEQIDGVDYQVITFHLPEQPAQAEAWYAWWINTATGNVERVAMIAQQHYMTWNYSDIDGDVTIEPPDLNAE